MIERVMSRDERAKDAVRVRVADAREALKKVAEQMTAGRLRLAKDELGVARGAVDGIERILTEMEFRAERRKEKA